MSEIFNMVLAMLASTTPPIEDAAAAWATPNTFALLLVSCDDSRPARCEFYFQHLPPLVARCTVAGCSALEAIPQERP